MSATGVQPMMRPRVDTLIASADSQFRRRWLDTSIATSKSSQEAEGGAHVLARLREVECDCVVLDMRLPDLNVSEVAALIRQRYPQVVVEVVDSRSTQTAMEPLMQYRAKESSSAEEIGPAQLELKNVASPSFEATIEALPGMIGSSRAMQATYQMVRLVAPRDTAVLLTGETGTGKELVAQAIHQLSGRVKNPFVAVNCAAIPEALLESELFGHVRGAFTGAVQSRLGRIHVAQGGTLFLDEIGELPLSMQAKLLRFLQNGEVQRLGSSDVYRTDIRVICATNIRLVERVQARQFRQDLYYRLAVFPVALPPLRQRLEDLLPLTEHFLEKLSIEAGVARPKLSQEAFKALMARRWEGNVRELQHALERAFILAGNSPMLLADHFRQFGEPELNEF